MNRIEHLLTILSEECAEVTKECSKALRFGLENPYQGTTSSQKIADELNDLIAVADMIKDASVIGPFIDDKKIKAKKDKVEKYLEYSKRIGKLK